ncbi:MAG: hypothetical protein EBV06_09405, partial [Planctomycetia bacterium]|nr:hypothetical protein [Planctomycetia bacterium]
RDLRERVYRAFISRASGSAEQGGDGGGNNGPLIERILTLRQEQAARLGYPHWAAVSLASKMAESEAEVEALLEELRSAAYPAAQQELEELRACAAAAGAAEAADLRPWDVSFWAERLRRQRFDLDSEALRPWFPLPQVLEGLFGLCERLFGVRIAAADGEAPVWHGDVRFFRVHDAGDGRALAAFYLDSRQFGIYATGTGVLTITGILRGGGSGNHLLSMRPDEFRDDGGRFLRYGSSFAMATLLVTITLAWPVAGAFASAKGYEASTEGDLRTVILLLGAAMTVAIIGQYPRARMASSLRFSELSLVDTISGSLKLASTVLLAAAGFGAVALAMPLLLISLFENLWTWPRCGMSRSEKSLKEALTKIPEMRERFWKEAGVPGSNDGMNVALEEAGRVADLLEFAELLCTDALERRESCGGHYREEYQDEGEAKRDDVNFQHVAAWGYNGPNTAPTRHVEPLVFTEVKPAIRSYK